MKDFFKKVIVFFLSLVVAFSAVFIFKFFQNPKVARDFSASIQDKIEGEKPFPENTGEIQKNFSWKFKGVNYEISETLYDSAYQYYKNQPKEYKYFGSLEDNWEEKYYAMFLNTQGNFLVANIAKDIEAQGKKNKLSDDEVAELVMSFVQAIPYDDAKAQLILSGSENATIEYPYETLYLNSGVCSDKSFLATVLLRSLGYGTALFVYEKENHMAIGIQCPVEYSTYQSGFCFGETTSLGNKIGVLPSLDSLNNKASAVLTNFDSEQQAATRQLGEVKIYQIQKGKPYNGIAKTYAKEKEMDLLKKEVILISKKLKDQKLFISSQQTELNSLKAKLASYKKSDEIEKYNSLVEPFNDLLEKNKNEIVSYNNQVSLYNQKITRYNALLEQ
jgi:hypothetical protein